jgi:hypothetical protein
MRPWAKQGDVFLVWRPENGETEEDAREVEALDAETAAEDFAEWDDSQGDYTIVRGSDATLHVRPRDGGDVERFQVSGEAVPQYSARVLT